jgi:hypothetical protein
MRRATLLVAAATLLLIGCATLTSVLHSSEEGRFNAGVNALANGDFTKAHAEFSWIAQHYADKSIGQRALLILAAMELDPRNPARRVNVGADLAASFLRLPEREAWVDPVAQTLYLLGLELGTAQQERAAEQREQERKSRDLPKLPGPTVTAKLESAEKERDDLAKRVAALEQQLAEKERELERIRKTIKR